MPEIKVNRPCDVVWQIITDIHSWKIWWGGTLKQVNPHWKVGATLEWENGDTGNVLEFQPLKKIVIKGNHHHEITTLSFYVDTPASTVVGIEIDISHSFLIRENEPDALEIELQSPLSQLKEYAERISETSIS